MKKSIGVALSATLFVSSIVVSTPVLAAQPAAASAPAAVCGVGAARLSGDGVALLSRGGSYSEVKSGAALNVGDRLIAQKGSVAVMVGGTQISQVEAGSMVNLVKKGDALCAAQLSTNPSVVAADLPARHSPASYDPGPVVAAPVGLGLTPMWIAGGLGLAAVGVGVGLAVTHSSKSGCDAYPAYCLTALSR
ncbi:MAG: hypothetical protein KGL46_14170 [Hyphomicrobiales bacterium]|nr:hypothetical protein [Hyphomicrobiales bacterium]